MTLRIATIFFVCAASLMAIEPQAIRVEGGLTVSAFQQQVKTEVGGETGDPLINEFQIGLYASGLYEVADFASLGLYLRLDRGQRSAAQFDGFDADNAAQVRNQVGGTYTEFWFGPLAQLHWKRLSLDFGYGLIGTRSDRGRDDLPSAGGDTEGAFSVSPSVAWLVALGGSVPLSEHIDIIFKLEYRVRYYTERDGELLINEVEHGTQSIAPLLGVAWTP